MSSTRDDEPSTYNKSSASTDGGHSTTYEPSKGDVRSRCEKLERNLGTISAISPAFCRRAAREHYPSHRSASTAARRHAEIAPRSRRDRAEIALRSRRDRAEVAPRSRRDRAEVAPRSRLRPVRCEAQHGGVVRRRIRRREPAIRRGIRRRLCRRCGCGRQQRALVRECREERRKIGSVAPSRG